LKAKYRKAKEAMSPSTKSLFTALIGDVLVAAYKTVAAVWTGSAAMMSEAIHSFVDTTNEVLLLSASLAPGEKPMPIIPSDTVRPTFVFTRTGCVSIRNNPVP
jgi:Co/Zn/Cd efflux system component